MEFTITINVADVTREELAAAIKSQLETLELPNGDRLYLTPEAITIDEPGHKLTEEQLIKLLRAQRRSAQLWINAFHKHRDGPGCKNAAFALGKVFGVFNTLLQLNRDQDATAEVMDIMTECTALWDEVNGTGLRRFEGD